MTRECRGARGPLEVYILNEHRAMRMRDLPKKKFTNICEFFDLWDLGVQFDCYKKNHRLYDEVNFDDSDLAYVLENIYDVVPDDLCGNINTSVRELADQLADAEDELVEAGEDLLSEEPVRPVHIVDLQALDIEAILRATAQAAQMQQALEDLEEQVTERLARIQAAKKAFDVAQDAREDVMAELLDLFQQVADANQRFEAFDVAVSEAERVVANMGFAPLPRVSVPRPPKSTKKRSLKKKPSQASQIDADADEAAFYDVASGLSGADLFEAAALLSQQRRETAWTLSQLADGILAEGKLQAQASQPETQSQGEALQQQSQGQALNQDQASNQDQAPNQDQASNQDQAPNQDQASNQDQAPNQDQASNQNQVPNPEQPPQNTNQGQGEALNLKSPRPQQTFSPARLALENEVKDLRERIRELSAQASRAAQLEQEKRDLQMLQKRTVEEVQQHNQMLETQRRDKEALETKVGELKTQYEAKVQALESEKQREREQLLTELQAKEQSLAAEKKKLVENFDVHLRDLKSQQKAEAEEFNQKLLQGIEQAERQVNAEKQELIKTIEQITAEADQKLQAKDIEVTLLQNELRKAENEIEDADAQAEEDVNIVRRTAENALAAKEQEARMLRVALQERQKEIETLTQEAAEVNVLRQQLASSGAPQDVLVLQQENAKLAAQAAVAETRLREQEREVGLLQDKIKQEEASVGTLRQELQVLRTRNIGLSTVAGAVPAQGHTIEELRKQIGVLEQQLAAKPESSTPGEILALQQRVAELQAKADAADGLAQSLKQKEAEANALASQVQQEELKLQALEPQANLAQTLQQQVAVLTERIAQMAAINASGAAFVPPANPADGAGNAAFAGAPGGASTQEVIDLQTKAQELETEKERETRRANKLQIEINALQQKMQRLNERIADLEGGPADAEPPEAAGAPPPPPPPPGPSGAPPPPPPPPPGGAPVYNPDHYKLKIGKKTDDDAKVPEKKQAGADVNAIQQIANAKIKRDDAQTALDAVLSSGDQIAIDAAQAKLDKAQAEYDRIKGGPKRRKQADAAGPVDPFAGIQLRGRGGAAQPAGDANDAAAQQSGLFPLPSLKPTSKDAADPNAPPPRTKRRTEAEILAEQANAILNPKQFSFSSPLLRDLGIRGNNDLAKIGASPYETEEAFRTRMPNVSTPNFFNEVQPLVLKIKEDPKSDKAKIARLLLAFLRLSNTDIARITRKLIKEQKGDYNNLLAFARLFKNGITQDKVAEYEAYYQKEAKSGEFALPALRKVQGLQPEEALRQALSNMRGALGPQTNEDEDDEDDDEEWKNPGAVPQFAKLRPVAPRARFAPEDAQPAAAPAVPTTNAGRKKFAQVPQKQQQPAAQPAQQTDFRTVLKKKQQQP